MSKLTLTLGALAGAIGITGVVLGSVALAKVQSSTPVAAPSAAPRQLHPSRTRFLAPTYTPPPSRPVPPLTRSGVQ